MGEKHKPSEKELDKLATMIKECLDGESYDINLFKTLAGLDLTESQARYLFFQIKMKIKTDYEEALEERYIMQKMSKKIY